MRTKTKTTTTTCSGGDDDGVTDTLLWKPLYHQVFCPDMCRLYGNRFLKETVGLTYFSLFQLMIKVKRKLSSSSSQQQQEREHTNDGDEQKIAVLKESDLDDVTVLVNAQHKNNYFTRQYVGIGKMNKDQIVEIHMPDFGDLCDMGKYMWWKEASELCEKKNPQPYVPPSSEHLSVHQMRYLMLCTDVFDVLQARGNPNDKDYWERNADDLIWTENAEKRSSFPTVSIFIVKNNSTILKKIYSGKPKWRFRDEDHVESYGPMPDIYDQGSIAHLFDSVHLAVQCDDKLMVTHDSPYGLYSDEQLDKYMGYDDDEYYDSEDEEYSGEERKDLNDEEFVALRKKDVMSFVSGPK